MFLIGLFFVCVIGSIIYFLVALESQKFELIEEGVKVLKKNRENILTDERVGYEMKLPQEILLKTKEDMILFYSSHEKSLVVGGIRIFENENNLTLHEWIEKLHKEIGFLYYDSRENIKIGGIDAIKIKVEGEIETYEYFFKKENKIVGISLPTDRRFMEYVQSVRLIR